MKFLKKRGDAATTATKKPSAIGSWMKDHKKLTTLIIVLLTLALLVGCAFLFLRNLPLGGAKKAASQSYEFIRTVTLRKDTLSEVVSTTGTVNSNLTSNVTYSSVSNVRTPKVKTVNFSVGDSVEEGAIIIVLDTENVQESIDDELEKLAKNRESQAKRIADAKENYDEAIETYNDAVADLEEGQEEYEEAREEYFDLEEAYEDAEDYIERYQDDYDDLVAEEAKLSPTYLKYKQRYEDRSDDLTDAQDALERADEDDDIERLREELEEAEEAFLEAQERYLDIKDEYDEISDELALAKQELQSAKTLSDYDTLKNEYEAAERTYESAESQLESLESKVKSAEKSMKNAKENYEDELDEDVSTSDTLEDLYKELENCNLKAETAGKITALNVNVGDTPNGTIATIEDTDALKVAITIAEADINTVEIGMQCRVSSDATNGEIYGRLIQIDPTTMSSGYFGAEVLITTENTGLKIGMNASVDIIISSTDDCFTVPMDAVGKDDARGDYIYRKTGGEGVNMTFEKVYITTGESNDYYIEISADDLQEGDVIRASADLTQGIETSSTEDEGFGFGMMPGGMPSGGFGGGMPSGGFGGGMPSGGGMSGSGRMPSGGFSGGGMPSGGGMRP